MQAGDDGQIADALGFHNNHSKSRRWRGTCSPSRSSNCAMPPTIWQAAHGNRPTMFLANMGSVSHHTARATYAKNFFEAGGFEVSATMVHGSRRGGRSIRDIGATVAVICSSDKLYPELVPPRRRN